MYHKVWILFLIISVFFFNSCSKAKDKVAEMELTYPVNAGVETAIATVDIADNGIYEEPLKMITEAEENIFSKYEGKWLFLNVNNTLLWDEDDWFNSVMLSAIMDKKNSYITVYKDDGIYKAELNYRGLTSVGVLSLSPARQIPINSTEVFVNCDNGYIIPIEKETSSNSADTQEDLLDGVLVVWADDVDAAQYQREEIVERILNAIPRNDSDR